MRQLGFPQNSSLYPGKAYIYRCAKNLSDQGFEPEIICRDPDFCTIFPDGNSSELDDGEFLEVEEKEGKVGMDPRAQPFRPRGEGEGVMREDLEGEEEWCLVGREGIEWNGSESGSGSSFKGDGGSLESSEREELREVVGGEQDGKGKGGEDGEKSNSEAKNEDSGDD